MDTLGLTQAAADLFPDSHAQSSKGKGKRPATRPRKRSVPETSIASSIRHSERLNPTLKHPPVAPPSEPPSHETTPAPNTMSSAPPLPHETIATSSTHASLPSASGLIPDTNVTTPPDPPDPDVAPNPAPISAHYLDGSEWPDWLTEGHEELMRAPPSPLWTSLVNKVVIFEGMSGWPDAVSSLQFLMHVF
jgi:hypothetical protein